MKLERILVPVDFSHDSDRAARTALGLALRHGAAITLLHVDPLPSTGVVAVEPIYLSPDLWEGVQRHHMEKVERELKSMQSDLQGIVDRPVAVDLATRRGRTSDGIVEYAAEIDADLIVMGSHGDSGAVRYLLGSTAEKVSRVAPCPVLVSRPTNPEKEDDLPPLPPIRRALVGIDYSDFSLPSARLAARLVGPGGHIELAHIWPYFYMSALDAGTSGRRDELVQAMEQARQGQVNVLEQFAAQLELDGVRLDLYVGSGRAADELIDRAAEIRADVIVVGARTQGAARDLFIGTVADRVLRHAELPVLLLPAPALERVG